MDPDDLQLHAAEPPELQARALPGKASGTKEHLGGHEVAFPHEPYGVQRVFMAKLITALHNKQNALLEAPTGFGKTLCLLCGALAWQSAVKTQAAQAEANYRDELLAWNAEVEGTAHSAAAPTDGDGSDATAAEPGAAGKHAAAPSPPGSSASDEPGSDAAPLPDAGPPPKAICPRPKLKPIKVPTIFYATRTHSQISQVVRELKKTQYNPSMAILAGRKHYCINRRVAESGRVDELCEELNRADFGCRFHRQGRGGREPMKALCAHSVLGARERQGQDKQVHDIEDLVASGKKGKQCPYYTARENAQWVDLVLCPYQYLIDPNIRRALGINTAGAVLIFDEAHNIEDTSREAASMDITLDRLADVHDALKLGATLTTKPEVYETLQKGIEQLRLWLRDVSESRLMVPSEDGRSGSRQAIISIPQQIRDQLAAAGLAPQPVSVLTAAYTAAREYEKSKEASFTDEGDAAHAAVPANAKQPGAGAKALGVVGQLLTTLRMLYAMSDMPSGGAGGAAGGTDALSTTSGSDRAADYRLVVASAPASRDGGQQGSPAGSQRPSISLGLWCMHPGVAFSDLAARCHSVVLTSGTLSPLSSYASELGTHFHALHEGRHVVDVNKQVWAGVMGRGPSGLQLSSTFRNKGNAQLHDELGQALLSVAQVVPAGLLVFFPSYGLLDTLCKHWQRTGLWAALEGVKQIIVEPREAGGAFDAAILRHTTVIAAGHGSMLMAVCRGKASEGIDFRDAQARGVVIIGIPFPAARDAKVVLKKTFNDQARRLAPPPGQQPVGPPKHPGHAAAAHPPGMTQAYGGGFMPSATQGPTQRGGLPGTLQPLPPATQLVSGEAWYALQAYRAVNQAVGRCIRHRYDVGAVLLLDVRYGSADSQAMLPAWIRQHVQVHHSFNNGLSSLAAFFARIAANPPGKPATLGDALSAAAGSEVKTETGAVPGPSNGPTTWTSHSDPLRGPGVSWGRRGVGSKATGVSASPSGPLASATAPGLTPPAKGTTPPTWGSGQPLTIAQCLQRAKALAPASTSITNTWQQPQPQQPWQQQLQKTGGWGEASSSAADIYTSLASAAGSGQAGRSATAGRGVSLLGMRPRGRLQRPRGDGVDTQGSEQVMNGAAVTAAPPPSTLGAAPREALKREPLANTPLNQVPVSSAGLPGCGNARRCADAAGCTPGPSVVQSLATPAFVFEIGSEDEAETAALELADATQRARDVLSCGKKRPFDSVAGS